MSQQQNNAPVETGVDALKKHDIKVSTVVFMIFCLCAAGCYGIEEMMPESGPGLTIIMLILLPIFWSTPLGLVASELGSARPQEGGYYKWVQEALGEYWGFQAGWWRTISIYIDNTLYVILAGGYLAGWFNWGWGMEFALKVLMILVFTYINIRGVKDVGIVSTILSILVMVAFGMVAVCGFLNWEQNPLEPMTAEGYGVLASEIAFADWVYYIGMGIAIGMWMYAGYESMSTIAGEVSNPQVIPKATMITVPLIMAVYIFPTIGGLATLTDAKVAGLLGITEAEVAEEGGAWAFWGTEPGTVGYADVVAANWGPAFGLFFVIVAVLAQCSIYNTYITSGSRGFFALAEDYLAPPILVKVDKKHGVPYVAVLSVGIVNLILCNFAFSAVVVVDVFLLVSAYVMIFISSMILRKKIPEEHLKFKIPGGYPFLVFVCACPITIAFVAFFINGTDYFIGGALGIVSGPILYFIWKRMYGGLAKKDPEAFPLNPKTKLAVGDLRRMAFNFIILAAMCLIAKPWLNWFEGDWGAEYYAEANEGVGFLADFDLMLKIILISGVVFLIISIVLYLMSKKLEPSVAEIKASFKKSCDAITARHEKEADAMEAAVEPAAAE